jgi:hypothetical protein
MLGPRLLSGDDVVGARELRTRMTVADSELARARSSAIA